MSLTEELVRAVSNEDIPSIKQLLAQGALINAKDKNGSPPLYHAFNNFEVIKVLLENGALPNERDTYGSTLLHMGTTLQNPEIVKLLLKHGASPSITDEASSTPLHCCLSPHPESVELLLKRGLLPNSRDIDDKTPLHWLVEHSNELIVEKLLDDGAEIDPQDKHGNTPLHYAVAHQNSSAVNTLLKRGALVHKQNKEGETPLHKASCAAEIEMLLSRGAKIDARDNKHRTLLYKAVTNSHPEVVAMLLEKSASLCGEDKLGEIPLHEACKAELIDNYCRILPRQREVPEETTRTTLNAQVIELLLKYRASIQAPDEQGNTPLHIAAKFSDDPSIIAVLLRQNAPINSRNQEGMTPLQVAVKFSKHVSIIEILLNNENVDLNIVDNEGNTLLALAKHSKRDEDWQYNKELNKRVICLLLSNGVYAHQSSDKRLLNKCWYALSFQIEKEKHFYTTLLLTGMSQSSFQNRLPDNLRFVWNNIESTMRSWLGPYISEVDRTSVDWHEITCKVLRLLPRLIRTIERTEKTPLIERGCKIEELKSFLFIPRPTNPSGPYFLERNDDSDCDELPTLRKMNSNELDAMRKEILLNRILELPLELIIEIREKLAEWAMVTTSVADYQVEATIANYLVFAIRGNTDNYREFLKQLFAHDWDDPFTVPVGTLGAPPNLQPVIHP